MELRHLLYFKMVAEELHFRKAAEKLFISQPPLSRQIKELEEELGAQLFTRNNKRVTLTSAGIYFKKEVEEILTRINKTKNTVKQIHDHLNGEFRIGYISSTYHPLLMEVLKEMRVHFPYLSIQLYELPTQKQIHALEEGKLDIGIMRAPIASTQLTLNTLFHDPFIAVLPANSPQFSSNAALGKYLAEKPFIFFNRDYAPAYHQKLVEICNRLGFSPQLSHEANNVHSILRLVESGAGVSILPHSLKEHYKYLQINFADLKNLSIYTEVVLAYKNNNHQEALQWFIKRYNPTPNRT